MKHGVKLLKRRNFVCNLKRCTTKKGDEGSQGGEKIEKEEEEEEKEQEEQEQVNEWEEWINGIARKIKYFSNRFWIAIPSGSRLLKVNANRDCTKCRHRKSGIAITSLTIYAKDSAPHHPSPPLTALVESPRADAVQACSPCVQVSARHGTAVTAPSYLAVELQCTVDFQAAARRPTWNSQLQHVTSALRTVYVCFPRSPKRFPLQAFLPMTFTATSLVPAQLQLSFSET